MGDVHGRADLLRQMLERSEEAAPDAVLVTVGDYVDRGPDSREVLDILGASGDLVALRGNHEDMLLRFLDDPEAEAPRWLRNGGRATLASFGVPDPKEASELSETAKALRAALGATEAWLRALPPAWLSGDVFVTHAGADPARPPEDQEHEVMTWGHPLFSHRARSDGLWVARGHRIRWRPSARHRRIQVDTGAWRTGRLTAALVRPGERVRFLTVRGSRG
ncbi:metallophosphoesterase family protein [Roseitranquillus sediminis]|uniref:metallophosphoesterase family protein n=1 Tax=Roseitranquillus sediminis TaxID=2809051 RepID=UPI0029C9C9AE|nr:metallophosphoesterase family protein [Roseitranquillus sediminis]